jgi:hypothetical protein
LLQLECRSESASDCSLLFRNSQDQLRLAMKVQQLQHQLLMLLLQVNGKTSCVKQLAISLVKMSPLIFGRRRCSAGT